MNVRASYALWAATYDTDRNLTRDLDADVTRKLLDRERPARVIELGCGTGKNTGFFASISDEVLAIDQSGEMLDLARSRSPLPRTRFIQADLTLPWPCADRYAALISCNLVLEHIEDLSCIFAEAYRTLSEGGRFFVSELHPFRQYLGTKATFVRDGRTIEIPSFVHHVSAVLSAAGSAGLALLRVNEWWHDDDAGKPPRLITYLFQKS